MQNVNSAAPSSESRLDSNGPSTVSSLRMSLMSVQMELDEANNELSQLRLENAKLKAAALPTRGQKKNRRIVVTTPIDYSQDLLTIANKFTLLDFVWVKMTVFQSPCPPSPIPIETRYSDAANTVLHIRYRLFECFPEKYHGYLRELSEIGANFNRLAQQQRSNIIAKLHTAVSIIFSDAYPEIIPNLLSSPKDRGTSELCRRLYMSDSSMGNDNFEPLLAPIIYAGGNITVGGIFQNEVLFLAIYLVSNDSIFEEVGSKSGINYGSAFLAYKQRLEMHENKPLFQKIIKVWNARLFGEVAAAADSAEHFDFESVNARSAAIDAALSGGPLDESELEPEVISSPTSLSFIPDLNALSVTSQDGSQPAGAPGPLSSVSGLRREVVVDPPPITHPSSHACGTLASRSNSVVFTLPASNPGSVFSLQDQNDYSSDSDGQHEIIQPDSSEATQPLSNPIRASPVTQSRPINTPIPVNTRALSVNPAPPTNLTLEAPTTRSAPASAPITRVPSEDQQVINEVNAVPARPSGKRGRPKKATQDGGAAGTRRSTRNQRG
ncbi:hypothetical protein AGABI1DRAFT_130980 [Agaricus bisporus var. burnettii JB137-S8]|uniref:Uncharacterized protein n=1 Tax=Agaricus bisporus var. burnettii (strain JB137-S8 / ATCC MYA-4627 / FGSC 10392) TaxID=597362 RepID=K5XPN8_AGABU|nr:uncharacterized protein AGABI1DRAFT_130980 [Agaricus bisporus var. burnettii JB137-S8]EKM76685.1 hypothetical protein AGABI1DRAFT_130980 [Agaricus bisporus var. burnettii JB137-S8]